MNVAVVMLVSLAALGLGFVVYGRLIARVFGVDETRTTPAISHKDGVDFVPTHPVVLFGHHFASIAAAGPIVGPTLALMFGFLPAWIWVVVGVVLIGAVHDFASLFVSMREGGRSVAEVARTTLGTAGFVLYAAFAIVLCILASAAFLDLTARSLTALYPLTALGLPPDQTLLATDATSGVVKARVGGIASTSVVIITLAAPLLGYLLYKRNIRVLSASLLALVLCVASIAIGFTWPITIDGKIWMMIVLVYTFVAGFVPVWVILQPRDFVNVQFLYVGLAVLVVAVIGCGIHGVKLDVPMMNLDAASNTPALGPLWPVLFVTIACGSVSGAHGLICGGTTCKQISNEGHARIIGYGGMLLEGLLAICVMLVLGAGLGFDGYKQAVWATGAPGAPVAFAAAVGTGIYKGLGSPAAHQDIVAYGTIFGIILLEGFLVTTIDTVIRLSRYLVEEVAAALLGERTPAWLKNRGVTMLLVIVPTAGLAFTNGYRAVWPLFGAANQLLAALTLTAVSVWLWKRKKKYLYTAIPAVFMTATTAAALLISLRKHLSAAKTQLGLAATALVLLALGVGVVVVTLRQVLGSERPKAES